MIRIHNISTDEIIDREMNAKELAEYNDRIKKQELAKIEAEAKSVQRQAILDRLGLTSEEASLLLS